jgi:hypothetical protein
MCSSVNNRFLVLCNWKPTGQSVFITIYRELINESYKVESRICVVLH